jgi:hypothetical protein
MGRLGPWLAANVHKMISAILGMGLGTFAYLVVVTIIHWFVDLITG